MPTYETDPVFTAWKDTVRAKHTIYSGPPDDPAAVAEFRLLVVNDIPDLSELYAKVEYITKTIAELNAWDGDPIKLVYITDDFKYGLFRYIAGSSTAEDTIMYFRDADNNVYQRVDTVIRARYFGAQVNVSGFDNTTALNALFAYTERGVIAFESGAYNVNGTLTIADKNVASGNDTIDNVGVSSLTIEGNGARIYTHPFSRGTTVGDDKFQINNSKRIHIKDLQIDGQTTVKSLWESSFTGCFFKRLRFSTPGNSTSGISHYNNLFEVCTIAILQIYTGTWGGVLSEFNVNTFNTCKFGYAADISEDIIQIYGSGNAEFINFHACDIYPPANKWLLYVDEAVNSVQLIFSGGSYFDVGRGFPADLKNVEIINSGVFITPAIGNADVIANGNMNNMPLKEASGFPSRTTAHPQAGSRIASSHTNLMYNGNFDLDIDAGDIIGFNVTYEDGTVHERKIEVTYSGSGDNYLNFFTVDIPVDGYYSLSAIGKLVSGAITTDWAKWNGSSWTVIQSNVILFGSTTSWDSLKVKLVAGDRLRFLISCNTVGTVFEVDDVSFVLGSESPLYAASMHPSATIIAEPYVHPTQDAIDTGDLTGASVISKVTVNTLGHTTAVSTRSLTASNLGAVPTTRAIDIVGSTEGSQNLSTDRTWTIDRILRTRGIGGTPNFNNVLVNQAFAIWDGSWSGTGFLNTPNKLQAGYGTFLTGSVNSNIAEGKFQMWFEDHSDSKTYVRTGFNTTWNNWKRLTHEEDLTNLTFIGLADTPAAYVANRLVLNNNDGDAITFLNQTADTILGCLNETGSITQIPLGEGLSFASDALKATINRLYTYSAINVTNYNDARLAGALTLWDGTYLSNITNNPKGSAEGYGTLLVGDVLGGGKFQMFFDDVADSHLYVRSYFNSWRSWKRLATIDEVTGIPNNIFSNRGEMMIANASAEPSILARAATGTNVKAFLAQTKDDGATYPTAWSVIEYDNIWNVPSLKLLGRYSSGAGQAQVITISDGLNLSPTGVLTATGASGDPDAYWGADGTNDIVNLNAGKVIIKGGLLPDPAASIDIGENSSNGKFNYAYFKNKIFLANGTDFWVGDTLGSAKLKYLGLGGASGSSTYVLDVTGTIRASVDIISNSDINLKTNIQDLIIPLEKFKQIRPVSFNWKANDAEGIGVIAQEIEKVFPELVHTDEYGIKSVNYIALSVILLKTVQNLTNELHS